MTRSERERLLVVVESAQDVLLNPSNHGVDSESSTTPESVALSLLLEGLQEVLSDSEGK